MQGKTIPKKKDSLHMLGNFVSKLIMDGENVWEEFSSYRNYLLSGEFIVPPGVTAVRICGVGAGGGGSSSVLLGGSSGEIASSIDIAVIPGETILVVVGVGGITDEDGTESRFGNYIILDGGRTGVHQGEGDERISCGGKYTDGILVSTYYGGQAGAFANGGDGAGQAGKYGSGGGAGVIGGTGGNGRIIVRWSEGD